ncbi:selenocysteine-specific translation elongation factor [Comamonas humi]
MIIGTAGHIDHGKTTLVRALTGVDTDRLQEEKARGISIELGYAYAPLADGGVLGFIDVPGHEKFVHTMAAGAAGIDHVLLVVAADDGVMPQTREHLAIVQLLGVREGTVAITKADRVDGARLQAVEQEVQALLAATPLAGAPLFCTAAAQPGDAGTAALQAHLWQRAQQAASHSAQGLFRLAVDRVFTLPGQGTIVTGTVFAGELRVEASVQHSASGQAVRVRGIHAQNRASDTARAGQRCALKLAGIAKDAIARGDWMADPRALQASQRLDVQWQSLPDAPAVAPWTSVHVHAATGHCTAHVVPLQDGAIAPAGAARAQLVLDAPLFLLPGDRFIVRNAQASQTIAGGRVLDPDAPARKRRSAERMAWLDAAQTLVDDGDAGALIAQAPHGMERSRLQRLCGRELADEALPAATLRLPLPGGDALLVAKARRQQLAAQVLGVLQRFHEQYPDEPGVNSARLRRMACPALAPDALWQALLAGLAADGAIAAQGAWLHLPGHRLQLSDAEQALAERLRPAIAAGRYDPPWVRDLARDHQLGEEVVRQLLPKLARQGALHQVVKDLFYDSGRMDELAALLARLAAEARQAGGPGEVPAAAFRDATGLGRKRAIQLLEYFDRVGYTRRVRDAHLIRPDASWAGQG